MLLFVSFNADLQKNKMMWWGVISSLCPAVAGFLGFTSFFLGSLFSQTLVSMEVYRSMLGTIIDRLPEETGEDALTREEQKEDLFRMQAMFIKMPSGSGEAEKSHVSRVLLNVLDSQFSGYGYAINSLLPLPHAILNVHTFVE